MCMSSQLGDSRLAAILCPKSTRQKTEIILRTLVAMALTALMLPVLGLWAAASGIEKCFHERKGG